MQTYGVALLIALLPMPSLSQPHSPWTFQHLGMTLSAAKRTFLSQPPATLVLEEGTDRAKVRRGYFNVAREEDWLGVALRVSYGFSTKDSTLGYVLASYIESAQMKGSPIGLRDTLWNRLSRTHRPPDKDESDAISHQRVWNEPGRKIVATKVDGVAHTLVISITRPERGK